MGSHAGGNAGAQVPTRVAVGRRLGECGSEDDEVYSGMFPCFFGGFLSRLSLSMSSPRASRTRSILG